MRTLITSLGHRVSISTLDLNTVHVTYEQAFTTSNIQDFVNELEKRHGHHRGTGDDPIGEGGPSNDFKVDVQLHHVSLVDLWARARLDVAWNNGIALSIPNIAWNGFHAEARSHAGIEIASIILKTILRSVALAFDGEKRSYKDKPS